MELVPEVREIAEIYDRTNGIQDIGDLQHPAHWTFRLGQEPLGQLPGLLRERSLDCH